MLGKFFSLAISAIFITGIVGLIKLISLIIESSRPQNGATRAENAIAQKLRLVEGQSYIMQNLYIPNGDHTTEIDLVLLHEKGIFVIESKDYSGWIFGSQNANYWLQTFRSGKKCKFYNPIRQNETHIEALSKLLKLSEDNRPKSYIVFGDCCTLKRIPETTETTTICQYASLYTNIQADLMQRSEKYSSQTLTAMQTILSQYENPDETVKAKHREQFI